MKVALDAKPLQKLQAKFTTFSRTIEPALNKNTEVYTLELLQEVKRRASGRPGPNVVTGKYLSAFMIMNGRVINPSPQTRRLEYGYVGTDSAGRHYNQPPFPHFRPALAAVRPKFVASLPLVVLTTWRRA